MIEYHAGAELDSAEWWLFDKLGGSLLDLSSGYDLTLQIVKNGEVLLDKSTGLTGQNGAGIEPTGTPSLVADWAEDELELAPGNYEIQIQARNGSTKDFRWKDTLKILTWTSP